MLYESGLRANKIIWHYFASKSKQLTTKCYVHVVVREVVLLVSSLVSPAEVDWRHETNSSWFCIIMSPFHDITAVLIPCRKWLSVLIPFHKWLYSMLYLPSWFHVNWLHSLSPQSWRKRWFCLRSSKVLEYYKAEDGELRGVVNLEDCKAVNSDLFHKKYKYVFDIETKDRTYYLVAKTKEDMRDWVDALCTVCGFTSLSEWLWCPLVNRFWVPIPTCGMGMRP